MEMRCADCGCRVDRGERLEVCGDPRCCCHDLPVRPVPAPVPGAALDTKPGSVPIG